MRLLYTDTGLNNPLLPVYSLTAAEIALANLNPPSGHLQRLILSSQGRAKSFRTRKQN